MCEGIFPCLWDIYRLIKQEYEPITRIVNTAENIVKDLRIEELLHFKLSAYRRKNARSPQLDTFIFTISKEEVKKNQHLRIVHTYELIEASISIGAKKRQRKWSNTQIVSFKRLFRISFYAFYMHFSVTYK